MSSFDPDRRNDRYGRIDDVSNSILRASAELVGIEEASRASDIAAAQLFTAAIRLHVAKSDREERTFRPIAG